MIAYLDCHSGISGDMFLGAMLDAGLPYDLLETALAKLPLAGYQLKVASFASHGIRGRRFQVVQDEQEQPLRSFMSIAALLHEAPVSSTVRDMAIAIFRTLGEAESKIHGVMLDEVHFHELGAIDTIIDITGAAIAIEALGISQLYSSPLPFTRGRAPMAHGLLPLPAPATLELLSRVKAPWVPCTAEGELVTPTGAAILATLARFEMPPMVIERVGYGFGQRAMPWPNCLRACLGEAYAVGPTRL